jgi:hypothetical protein
MRRGPQRKGFVCCRVKAVNATGSRLATRSATFVPPQPLTWGQDGAKPRGGPTPKLRVAPIPRHRLTNTHRSPGFNQT